MNCEDDKNKGGKGRCDTVSVCLNSDSLMKEVKNAECHADLIREAVPKYGLAQDMRAKSDDDNVDQLWETVQKYGSTQKIRAEGDGDIANQVCETAPKYGLTQDRKTEGENEWNRQGEYTLDDYYALPDEKRVELIDGVFYDMSSPNSTHQILTGAIYAEFLSYIRRNRGSCVPLISPLDVQLDKDDKTILQPDVLIVCDREKFKKGIIYGAPDLVVEVLSKSTRNKDQLIKLNKYFNAGVREYWIIDPKNREIMVYTFENGVELHGYDAESAVPVGIFNGECSVDFGEIFEYAEFLGEKE